MGRGAFSVAGLEETSVHRAVERENAVEKWKTETRRLLAEVATGPFEGVGDLLIRQS